MNQLPLCVEQIILDYKNQLEYVERFSKCLDCIKKKYRTLYELSRDRTSLRYLRIEDGEVAIYHFGVKDGKYFGESFIGVA